MNFFSLFKRKLIYQFKKKVSIDNDKVSFNSLDDLMYHYGSDKANIFKTTQQTGHGYSEFYEKKLREYKFKEINILEIGSYAGASAAAFVKYFPNSKIFCLDINISNFVYESSNISVFGVDINDENRMIRILKKIYNKNNIDEFDLIIDDGSHNLSDILFSLNFFFKLVKKNGLYVIEDFKHPNYYENNKNIDHILVDEFLKNLQNKHISFSNIISEYNQKKLINSINNIELYKGNRRDSDICFISRN